MNDFSPGIKKSGVGSYCKPCAAERTRQYRELNREKVREKARKDYQKNIERENARHASYREKNREQIREKARERMRLRRAADPEAANAYTRAYKAANKERAQVWYARKAAARRAAIGEDRVTQREWREIKAAHNNCCAYCGKHFKRLTMDHIVPLSRGGRHVAGNIAPACQPCNSSKGNKEVTSWLASRQNNQAQMNARSKIRGGTRLLNQESSIVAQM